MDFPGLKHKGDYCKYVECRDSYDMISMNKDAETLEEYSLLDKFIKSCESKIRTSKEYSAFVSYIKNVIGIDFCQISSNILGSDGVTIEMHHNFFTLYDYVSIIINYLKETGQPINTFRVVDKVIDEHYELNVPVIMVAVTNHETIHNRDTFVNLNQAFGNLMGFVNKYKNYLTDDQKYKIFKYVQMCKENPSFDTGILDTEKVEKMFKM